MKLTLTLSFCPSFAALTAQSAVGEAVASVKVRAWSDVATWDCDCIPPDGHDVTILNGHQVETDAGDTLRAESVVVDDGGISDGCRPLPGRTGDPRTPWLRPGRSKGDVVFVGEGEHTMRSGPIWPVLDFGQGT